MVVRTMFIRPFIVTTFLFMAFQETAHADLDFAAATKPYQVSFADWVVVYLSTTVGTYTENYSVTVSLKMINKKYRFVVQGSYIDNAIGRQWYEQIGSKLIEQTIASQCKIWTGEGHPISLNDFEIAIRKTSLR